MWSRTVLLLATYPRTTWIKHGNVSADPEGRSQAFDAYGPVPPAYQTSLEALLVNNGGRAREGGLPTSWSTTGATGMLYSPHARVQHSKRSIS